MREIKFRAWNKKRGIMNYDNEDGTEDYWDGIYTSEIGMVNSLLNIPNKDDHYSISSFRNKYEIMQYTGLEDKNGAEIYEGDVIKTRLNRIYRIVHTDGVDIGCNAGEFEYWVTGFVPAAIDGVIDNSGESEFGYDQFVTGECEVIGNIYEHPHLLEEV